MQLAALPLLVGLLALQLLAAGPARARPAEPSSRPRAIAFDPESYRQSERLARQRKRAARDAAREDRARENCTAPGCRPSHYTQRRALGFMAIGVGAGCVGAGLITLLTAPALSILPHSSSGDSGPTSEERRIVGVTMGIGLPLLAVGIWAVRSPVLEARGMHLSVSPNLQLGVQTQLGLSARLSL